MDGNISKTFAENVKIAAKAKGIRLSALEYYVGVTPGYLSRKCHEGGRISLDTAVAMCTFLDTKIEDLLDTSFPARHRLREKEEELLRQAEEMTRTRTEIANIKKQIGNGG